MALSLALALALSLALTPARAAPGVPLLLGDGEQQGGAGARAGLLAASRAYRCGRFWCSQVAFPYGLMERRQLTVAQATAQLVEGRADTVQSSVLGVINQLRRSVDGDADQHWMGLRRQPLHPLTPTVALGFRNNVPVVFVPASSERGLGAVTLLSVTEPDAVVAGRSEMELAEHWRELLQQVFSEALWGLEFDRRHPLGRPLLAGAIAATLLGLLFGLTWLRRVLHRVLQRLRRGDQDLRESATRDMLAAYTGQIHRGGWEEPGTVEGDESGAVEGAAPLQPQESGDFLARLLRQRGLRTQASNLLELGLLSTSLVELSLVIAGSGAIAACFPAARITALLLMRQALMLPLLWLGLLVLRWLLVLVIDHSINTWSIEATLRNPSSRRYALRAVTAAKLLKNLASIVCAAIGVVATLLLLGVDRSLLTGAGVVAVGVGLLLRNLLDDFMQGLLVITTDRFALGDVVTIPPHSGLVENMSLFNTQLRGIDGQLTSLPNGQIRVVENLTKDWSRVNFVIEVAASEDLRAVLALIRQEAEAMASDPEWASYFLSVPEVLGVDEVRQSGCLIRVWMQTVPLGQWLVGREFRLRIKEAFDREGIRLGLPRQELLMERPPNAIAPP